jgi:hypothetical protein
LDKYKQQGNCNGIEKNCTHFSGVCKFVPNDPAESPDKHSNHALFSFRPLAHF